MLLIVGAGILLWSINLASNRALFIDEANVARNLYDRSFTGLFSPLDHEQYAPPLYLVLTKLLAELFGYREWVMRIPAFCGGLLAVFTLIIAGKRLLGGYWSLLPLCLLFANTTVLRYVTEIKPYAIDMGVAGLLIALHLRPRPRPRPNRHLLTWALLGALLPWWSLPSVFVLAAIGLLNVYRDRSWLLPIAVWLASFGILYVTVLASSVGDGYLNNFHREYFLFLPANVTELRQIGQLLLSLVRLAYGYTTVALLSGILFLVSGLILRKERWLLLPLLVVLLASVPKFYSLIERLVLFVLPGVWLLTALAARELYHIGRACRVATILLMIFFLTGTKAIHYFQSPVRTSDSRRLAQIALTSKVYFTDALAAPVLDYYGRVNSVNGFEWWPHSIINTDEVDTGEFTVLYDVTTSQSTLRRMDTLADRAAARGCKVDREILYRSAVLRIKCP